MKRGMFLAALAFIIPLAGGSFAHNADAGVTCVVMQANLDEISSSQTLAQELSLRKALLKRVLTCAKNDAQSLQANLNALQIDDAKDLQGRLSDKLNDAINYYDIELAKVGSLGIAGTQVIARESLAWRTSNYVPLAGQIANVILWSKNQNLFAAAKARLDQTARVVAFFESGAQNAALENALAAAESAYNAAADANADARSALVQFIPPDQSLDLVKHSLDLLSTTYQKFLDLSTVIQSLLSAPSK